MISKKACAARSIIIGAREKRKENIKYRTYKKKPIYKLEMLRKFIARMLVSRWLGPVAALVGVLLVSPSLNIGWFLDDYYERWILVQSPVYSDLRPAQSDMFRFIDDDAHRNDRLRELGLMPWWIYTTGVKGAFWKPLTTVTHIMDYKFWPDRPDIMHAHNLCWFGLMLLGASLLYRKISGYTVSAGLAIVLYAFDYSHATPAAWLANRNAVMAAFFGILAIYLHDQWRRHGSRLGAILAPISMMMSLLSAEAGIGAAAYLAAYALILDRGNWKNRFATIVPYILVVVIWRILWSWQGYGVSEISGDVFLDPGSHPFRFIELIFLRAPILLLGQWAIPPAEVALFLRPYEVFWLCLIGVAFLAILAVVFLPLLRRSIEARFWAVGMLLATVPICSTMPQNRQLTYVGIGAMGLLGQYLALALSGELWLGMPWVRRLPQAVLIGTLVFIHLIFAPLGMVVSAMNPVGSSRFLSGLHVIPGMTSADCDRDLVFVTHPLPVDVLHMLTARIVDGQPLPKTTLIMSPATTPLAVRRLDDSSLVLHPKSGYFSTPLSLLSYNMKHPLKQGEKIELPSASITIKELTEDGRPAEILFRFRVPLEDQSLKWIYWEGGKFKEFHPPEIGESIVLPDCGLPL